MASKPILILGGTGKAGRRVAAQLRQRGLTARVASRSGPQRFDWHDHGTWAPALDGVDSVYVVTLGADEAALRAFIDLTVSSGVGRLVMQSARAWERSGDRDLLAWERAVTSARGDWTILRPTWFAQNFSEDPFLRDMVFDGEVVLATRGGLVPFIDVEDIAAVAVAALTEEGHAGQTYELSGPRPLTFGAAVEEIARASGRNIRYVPASTEESVAHLTERGFPEEFATFLNRMFSWIEQGSEAHLSDGVQRVLGREPRDFGDYVKRTAVAGTWNARSSHLSSAAVVGGEL